MTTRRSSERPGRRSRRTIFGIAGAIVFLALLQTPAAERATLGAIGLYRAHGSGLMRRLGADCRFHPTCSVYAELAVRKYGVMRGLLKTGGRVVRCNPLSSRLGQIDYP